eukprot:TRINITY_DN934_c0_g1_i2.p1 TRINITY_DN934_c0_g1~~TRINITY_DN934_c0_g1_i2.p1  ORF type:complete len:265 (-),score=78.51 TRINITY_DN934_c0_g1_i2:2-796(-)
MEAKRAKKKKRAFADELEEEAKDAKYALKQISAEIKQTKQAQLSTREALDNAEAKAAKDRAKLAKLDEALKHGKPVDLSALDIKDGASGSLNALAHADDIVDEIAHMDDETVRAESMRSESSKRSHSYHKEKEEAFDREKAIKMSSGEVTKMRDQLVKLTKRLRKDPGNFELSTQEASLRNRLEKTVQAKMEAISKKNEEANQRRLLALEKDYAEADKERAESKAREESLKLQLEKSKNKLQHAKKKKYRLRGRSSETAKAHRG